MAGATPPGPTDPLKKPTETKDGTSPLSAGQSQGVTGASAGSAAPAAAAAAASGKGLTIEIKAPADVPKATDGTPLFSITADPKMPVVKVTASVMGVTSGADPTPKLDFEWTASVSYDSKDTNNGISAGGRSWALDAGKSRTIDAITAKGKVTGGAIAITFDKIRGGSLTITVTTTVGGQSVKGEVKGWRIQGTNPSLSAVNDMLPDDAMRRLTCLESQKQQFIPAPKEGGAMYPYFSGDKLLGVGIGQLTYPQPTDDQIWDWTANVKAAVVLYNQKKTQAKGYPKLVANSPNFLKLVKEYNDNLSKAPAPAAGAPAAGTAPDAGKPAPAPAAAAAPAAGGAAAAPPAAAAPAKPVQVKVPDFTEEQLQDDTIRGFNGWAGNDGFTSGPSGGLHEFRIKQDVKTKALVVEGDTKSGTVNAVWERVPIGDRPRKDDKDKTPEYVDLVKSYNPSTCVRNK